MTIIYSFTVIFLSVIIAFLIIRKQNIHCRQLERCISVINETGDRAMLFSDSLSDIMTHLSSQKKYSSGDFPLIFSDYLVRKNTSVPEAWRYASEKAFPVLYPWERDVVLEFGNKMFSCPVEKIEELTQHALLQLQEYKENAIEKRDRTIKTEAVCSVSAGLMIALLIL